MGQLAVTHLPYVMHIVFVKRSKTRLGFEIYVKNKWVLCCPVGSC
jgi:hypothetical protein